jgi:hypothetical protein
MRMCQTDLLKKQAAKTKQAVVQSMRSPANILGHLMHPSTALHVAQDSIVPAATSHFMQQQELQEWTALASLIVVRRQQNNSIQQLQQDLRAVQQLDPFLSCNNIALMSPLSLVNWKNQHSLTERVLFRGGSPNWSTLNALETDTAMMLSNSMNYGPPMTNKMTSSMTFPLSLPVCLARPVDAHKLSDHQFFLRQQIEVFQASPEDVSTHIRGRNKPIGLGQVGIRCRHCAHLPIYKRQKGSTYFPANKLGVYQAAQNMCTSHIQCGLCSEMPESIKSEFVRLLVEKGQNCHTGAGRPYWAKSATNLGLVDTEDMGIRFFRDLPSGAMLPLE